MFCRVFEEENISKATQLEYISKPAVAKQIHQLEERYDVLLFNRLYEKLTPTKAGKTLYSFIANILETLNRSYETIEETSEKHNVVINIGTSCAICDYLLPKVIGRFKQIFPDYKLSLVVGNTPQIVEN